MSFINKVNIEQARFRQLYFAGPVAFTGLNKQHYFKLHTDEKQLLKSTEEISIPEPGVYKISMYGKGVQCNSGLIIINVEIFPSDLVQCTEKTISLDSDKMSFKANFTLVFFRSGGEVSFYATGFETFTCENLLVIVTQIE